MKCPIEYCNWELLHKDSLLIHLMEEHNITPKGGKSIKEQVEMSKIDRIKWVNELLESIFSKNFNRSLEGEEMEFTEKDLKNLSIAIGELKRILKVGEKF